MAINDEKESASDKPIPKEEKNDTNKQTEEKDKLR